MSYRSDTRYWVVCDVCGGANAYTEGYQHSQEHADEMADLVGWHIQGGNHICDECGFYDPTAKEEP